MIQSKIELLDDMNDPLANEAVDYLIEHEDDVAKYIKEIY